MCFAFIIVNSIPTNFIAILHYSYYNNPTFLFFPGKSWISFYMHSSYDYIRVVDNTKKY